MTTKKQTWTLDDLIFNFKPPSILVQTKTIMLIGETRSGKTTLMETLIHGVTKVDNMQIYSQTRDPKINSAVIDYKNQKITLNILDTPGLNEKLPEKEVDIQININGGYDLSNVRQMINVKKPRTDKEIIVSIIEFAKLKVSDIDLVLFVYDIHKGLSKDALDTLAKYNQAFPSLMNNCAIVFTKCEKLTNDERKQILVDFIKTPIFHQLNISSMFKKGVYFVGAIDPFLRRLYPNLKNDEFMTEILKDIAIQRDKIINLIMQNDDQINTKTLSSWCVQQ